MCNVSPQDQAAVAGVIDLGTVETFPVFQAAQRGLIDQDTCLILLEAQVITGGLLQPNSPSSLSLDEAQACGLIDSHTSQALSELEAALHLIDQTRPSAGALIPVAAAIEEGIIKEDVGLRILQLQVGTGGVRASSQGEGHSLTSAMEKGLLSQHIYNKLCCSVNRRQLIDPNTAEKLSLQELLKRCVPDPETGLRLLPVSQQPGGKVCLRSGRKVGIFRAVQEGLIDRQVTIRLLEAQLFAGGIADPRSGHRLTVDEAVRIGLMDHDLACALLTRQLQAGGILDPANGRRLGLEEAVQRELLSPRMALRVLEALWAFTGMLWPQSGELLPITEALQQGVVSGELARQILSQRHAIGALYLPESSQVIPLEEATEILEPNVVDTLMQVDIPDVLPGMDQPGSTALNYPSWSSSTSPPPSSPPASPPVVSTSTQEAAPEEQAQHQLMAHLRKHSYIDAHSGQRLVLLEPELVELACAAEHSRADPQIDVSEKQATDVWMRNGSESVRDVQLTEQMMKKHDVDAFVESDNQTEVAPLSQKYAEKDGNEREGVKTGDGEGEGNNFSTNVEGINRTDDKVLAVAEIQVLTEPVKGREIDVRRLEVEGRDVDAEVVNPEKGQEETEMEWTETVSDMVKPLDTAWLDPSLSDEHVHASQPRRSAREREQQEGAATENVKAEQSEESLEMEQMAMELQQGGLLTESGDRLLLDEAVAQGVLPAHTAVKLMAEAGLFGGFLDVNAYESLSVDDVVQEGLMDESLLSSVLKSEKTLAGVVDLERGRLCSLREAAQKGLVDENTATRLLEAQVVAGGVVDLRRDKKVSVTLAANLGLIEEGQKEELLALEKACRGKASDPHTSLTKAKLQLQMDGVVDPETREMVPLKESLQKGLITEEDAQQALSQQVAEGGLVHYGSGMRLSVSVAKQRGLVTDKMVQNLEKVEKARQGEEPFVSAPDSALFQASTGSVFDPASGSRLTLTEAVAQGLLDDNIANTAMTSPGVKSGVMDPHSARIIPYLELVNQAKIDIETGRRFLEVRPFQGILDEHTGDLLTLPQAVESHHVDPVSAFRMLQSQADTGGVIDISSGERLPLPEAVNRGLIGEDMAKEIAANQLLKGGLIDPTSWERVPNLKEAIQDCLITRDMAEGLQDNLSSTDEDEDVEGGSSGTLVSSTNGTWSPQLTSTGSNQDKQIKKPGEDVYTVSPPVHSTQMGAVEPDFISKANMDSSSSDEMKPVQGHIHEGFDSVEEKITESDGSMEMLTEFALNAERRIQQALLEIQPPQSLETDPPSQLSEQDVKAMEDIKTDVEPSSMYLLPTQPHEATQIPEVTNQLHDSSSQQSTDMQTSGIGETSDIFDLVVREDISISQEKLKPESVVAKNGQGFVKADDILTTGNHDDKVEGLKHTSMEEDISAEETVKLQATSDVDSIDSSVVTQSETLEDMNSQDKKPTSLKGLLQPYQEIGKFKKGDRSEMRITSHHESQELKVEEIKDPLVSAKKLDVSARTLEETTTKGLAQGAESPFDQQPETTKDAPKDKIENVEREKVGEIPEEKVVGGQTEKKKKKKKRGKKGKQQVVEETEEKGEHDGKEKESVDITKTTAVPHEKEALLMKAKEGLLRKVFERGVSDKRVGEELEALRQGVSKKEHHVEEPKDEKKPSVPPTKESDTREIEQLEGRLKESTDLQKDSQAPFVTAEPHDQEKGYATELKKKSSEAAASSDSAIAASFELPKVETEGHYADDQQRDSSVEGLKSGNVVQRVSSPEAEVIETLHMEQFVEKIISDSDRQPEVVTTPGVYTDPIFKGTHDKHSKDALEKDTWPLTQSLVQQVQDQPVPIKPALEISTDKQAKTPSESPGTQSTKLLPRKPEEEQVGLQAMTDSRVDINEEAEALESPVESGPSVSEEITWEEEEREAEEKSGEMVASEMVQKKSPAKKSKVNIVVCFFKNQTHPNMLLFTSCFWSLPVLTGSSAVS